VRACVWVLARVHACVHASECPSVYCPNERSTDVGRGNKKSTNLRLVLADSWQHTEITFTTPGYWWMFVEIVCNVQYDHVVLLVSTMLHVDHVVSR